MRQDFMEKRKYQRFDSRIPVQYKRMQTNTAVFRGGLMKDISEGGARMSVYEFLSRDLKLLVEASLLTGVSPIRGTCRVAWVRKSAFGEQYDIGVKFDDFAQEDTKRIAKFVFLKALNKLEI